MLKFPKQHKTVANAPLPTVRLLPVIAVTAKEWCGKMNSLVVELGAAVALLLLVLGVGASFPPNGKWPLVAATPLAGAPPSGLKKACFCQTKTHI